MQQAIGSWQLVLDINNHYFKSYKHFVGKKNRNKEEEGSNVCHSYETDFTIMRVISRWSIEHYPYWLLPVLLSSTIKNKAHYEFFGGCDIRFAAYR
jgi:hypothetical protein